MVVAAAAFFQGVNAKMRAWGYTVEEQPGCWTRGNGSSWTHGGPIAATNHHFVISLNSPIANGVNNVTNGDSELSGPKCNYYGGIDPGTGKKRLIFISAGPANHAGQGRSEPRDRMAANQAPLGWVAESYSSSADNWSGGNTSYMGTELHHPGDATPWPPLLLELIVDLNAAAGLVGGWPAARAHMHAEHSARKIDMSWLRGQGGHELRRRVAARMGAGTTPQPPEDDSMSAADVAALKGYLELRLGAQDAVLATIAARLRGDPKAGLDALQSLQYQQDAIAKDTHDTQVRVRGVDTAKGQKHEGFDMLQGIDAQTGTPGPPPVTPPAGPDTYTVKAGDTLTSISAATGKSVADLVAWNSLASADAINVGQVLRLGP